MKQFFSGPLADHSRNILRRLGYGEQRTRQGQISYVKRVASERFPRYHAYVEDRDNGMQINLHLDQKAATYEGTSAHGGEYEGVLVEKEMERLAQFIKNLKPANDSQDTTDSKSKKGFWGNLFR